MPISGLRHLENQMDALNFYPVDPLALDLILCAHQLTVLAQIVENQELLKLEDGLIIKLNN